MKALQGRRWLAMALITLLVSGLMIPGTAGRAAAGYRRVGAAEQCAGAAAP